jgi:4'-phosphopantetheinyl transferase
MGNTGTICTSEWASRRTVPPLTEDEIHVWLVHLPAVIHALPLLGSVLSQDERQRVARFRFPEHRQRSQATRGLLRHLLARYTGASPAAVSFRYGAHGKPALASGDIEFNTSHSGDYAVFAFGRGGALGVDIEQVREEMSQLESIARRHFSMIEHQQWAALPDAERTRAFFEFWTRKEAFVKARGDGVFSGLANFSVPLGESSVRDTDGMPLENWSVFTLPAIPGCAGTLVAHASGATPKFFLCNSVPE